LTCKKTQVPIETQYHKWPIKAKLIKADSASQDNGPVCQTYFIK